MNSALPHTLCQHTHMHFVEYATYVAQVNTICHVVEPCHQTNLKHPKHWTDPDCFSTTLSTNMWDNIYCFTTVNCVT